MEALLFLYGEPMEIKKIAKILEVAEEEAVSVAESYEKELAGDGRGLSLLRDGKKIQLVTKPTLTKFLENFTKEEFTADLTPASLETLSIVAYASPISRAEIEFIRGVNSSFTLRNLLIRGLVERSIDPKRANAYLYSPSFDLLKKLGISNSAELPDFEKYSGLVKLLYAETAETMGAEKVDLPNGPAAYPIRQAQGKPEQSQEVNNQNPQNENSADETEYQ